MKNIFTLIFLFITVFGFTKKTKEINTSNNKPKLVIGLVIDQMRWDYLYRFQEKYTNGGFNLLTNKGYSCEYAHYNYVPTYTAPGHTSIYTGTVPALHGIIGNGWYDKLLKKNIYCVTDENYKTVGSTTNVGTASPKNLLTTTIGDELKISNANQSKVIGIAIKDRSSILPAGHAANAAYWFDGKSGRWITSSYYGLKTLPSWVEAQNKIIQQDKYQATKWQTLLALQDYHESTEDNVAWEASYDNESTPTFNHDVEELLNVDDDILKALPYGNTMTLNLAKACIQNEQLGKSNYPDLLCVSLSSTDIIGHQFGCNAIEIEDMYLRLDKDIADFIMFLDTQLGRANYVLFLTADHGAANNASFLQSHKIPAGNEISKVFKAKMDSFLLSTFNTKDYIESITNQQIFLNHTLLDAENDLLDEVKSKLAQFLLSFNEIADVVDFAELDEMTMEASFKSKIINSYNKQRSGDLYIQLQPAWMSDYIQGTTHGSGYNYDTHIPMIFFGNNIPCKKDYEYRTITDIAATISAILQIQEPNACTGKPIQGVLEK